MANENTPSRARRDSTQRWSASTTTKFCDTNGNSTTDPALAVRAQVRWRYDAKQRKATFSGADAPIDARRLASLITAAYEHDWAADEKGRPIVSVTPPPPPAPVGPVGLPQPHVAAPVLLPEPAPNAIVTVADLIEWHSAELRSRPSNQTGAKLQGKTLDCYDSEYAFIKAALVYPHDDLRLGSLKARGVVGGDSLTLDADVGVTSVDLYRMIDLRWETNMRTRTANERRMRLWAQATEQELKDAVAQGRGPAYPPRPSLDPEQASPETARACFRAAQRLFKDALSRGIVDHEIWTLTVSDRPRLPNRQITTTNIYSPKQVLSITDTLAEFHRNSRDRHGASVTVTGDRYVAYVLCEAVLGPRPGALQAMRRSWINLDGPEPYIVWREAAKYASKANSGADTHRTVGALKHRDPSVHRIERIPAFLVPVIERHLALYVAEPTTGDPDPLIFTTHNGAPINQDNFCTDWWNPAVSATFPDAHQRRTFRSLRKTAITDMLISGNTLYDVSSWVGASQTVIEKSYRAVHDEINVTRRWRTWSEQ